MWNGPTVVPEAPAQPSCRPTQSVRHIIDLTDLYNSAALSDVRLAINACDGTVELNAHRIILVSGSSFMRSALSKEWLPSSDDDRPAVSLQTEERLTHCERLVQFLYGLEIELDLESAHPLLRLADYYGVDALVARCMDFLERVLHPEPARCFIVLGDSPAGNKPAPQQPPSQPRLMSLCAEVFSRSFGEVARHPDFVTCSPELLLAVMERDDLSVDFEEEVLEALLRWVEHAPAARQEPLVELLRLVRWPTIAGETLAGVEESSLGLGMTVHAEGELHAHRATNATNAASVTLLRDLLLEAFRYQAAAPSRRQALVHTASDAAARRYRPRAPNMVKLIGEGKFNWTLKNFSRLCEEERLYSPPFSYGGITFMLLFFPRGNQQREFASLYVSIADKARLPPNWQRNVHFSLWVVDQKESLCSITKSTSGELSPDRKSVV